MSKEIQELTKQVKVLTEEITKIKGVLRVETNTPTLPELINELEISVSSLEGLSTLIQRKGAISEMPEDEFQNLVFKLHNNSEKPMITCWLFLGNNNNLTSSPPSGGVG